MAIGRSLSYEESDARHLRRPHARDDTVARMSGDTPRPETGAQPLPQGLPRRPRGAPPVPRIPEETAGATGQDDDAEDTLRPDALALAMVAIQRGSTRARLAAADDTGLGDTALADTAPHATAPHATAPIDTDDRWTPRPGPGAA